MFIFWGLSIRVGINFLIDQYGFLRIKEAVILSNLLTSFVIMRSSFIIVHLTLLIFLLLCYWRRLLGCLLPFLLSTECLFVIFRHSLLLFPGFWNSPWFPWDTKMGKLSCKATITKFSHQNLLLVVPDTQTSPTIIPTSLFTALVAYVSAFTFKMSCREGFDHFLSYS